MTLKNQTVWQLSLDANEQPLYAWIKDAGSFMERLQQHGVNNAKIEILRQDWFVPEAWESALLGLKNNEQTYVREVRIFSDAHVWLYGRTVFPAAMLETKQELSHLENRSLGSVLFQDPAIKRSHLEFTHAKPAELWQYFLSEHRQPSWIRRSLFNLKGNALLLTEILMPDLEKLCLKN